MQAQELAERLATLQQNYASRLATELDALVMLAKQVVPEQGCVYREQLRSRLHKLAGSAGTYGFAEVGQRAAQLLLLVEKPHALVEVEQLLHETALLRATLDAAGDPGRPDAQIALRSALMGDRKAKEANETKGLRLLLVDDDEDHCRLLATVLQCWFEVVVAHTSDEALALYLEAKPDIVLLDIELPGSDGYQICTALMQARPKEWCSIIFVSVRDELEDKIKAFDAGGDDFIAKPLDFDEFLPKLKALAKFTLSKKELLTQQQVARQMAFSSMAESAQYGQLADFMRKAMQCDNHERLVEVFFDTMAAFGLNVSLHFRGRDKHSYSAPGRQCSPIEANLFSLLKEAGRLYHFGARTLVNDKHVAFLVKNMPLDDAVSYGRLTDVAVALIEALEESYLAINRKLALATAVDNIGVLLQRITEFLAADSETVTSLQALSDLMKEMEDGFHFLELNEVQEKYLYGLLDKGGSNATKVIETLNKLRDDLADINQALDIGRNA